MEREKVLTEEEIVSRITGLPLGTIFTLMEECNMPVDVDGLSAWLRNDTNAQRLFEEQKRHFNEIMNFPQEAPVTNI